MEWILTLVEKILFGLGALIGQGLGAAGEKVGASLPAGRPMDRLSTARRMSREQKELYKLYKRLWQHEPQAEGIVTSVCRGAVEQALNPSLEDLTNPFVLAANELCQDILRFE